MECEKLKCDIIDECKCYAKKGEKYPNENQFCGVRRGSRVFACNPGCCAGGCPGQCKKVIPKPPFSITDDLYTPFQANIPAYIKVVLVILLGLVIMSTLSLRK
ncbi:hypothetical protein [Dishui Lake phycodnavirus 3]|nr:hypothetical protein [Dishui Lake phycodnavirus 3]